MEPVDPFADDPADPAAELADLEPEDGAPVLAPDEREDILGDLADLESFEALLAPRGVRGIVVDCRDCDSAHYFGWQLLRSNLRSLLDLGRTGVHEPAYAPDPDDYVSWDYARGFADGVLDAAED